MTKIVTNGSYNSDNTVFSTGDSNIPSTRPVVAFSPVDTTVIVSCGTVSGTCNTPMIRMMNSNNQMVDVWRLTSNSTATFTGVSKMQIDYGRNGTLTVNEPMIRFSTVSDSTYEPYNGNTYSLTFTDGTNPLTVYGGYVDLVSGVLTVKNASVDLGTLDWQYSSISERFYVGASDLVVKATDATTPFNAISSALIAKSYNEIEAKTVDYAIAINPNATQLFARYSSITSASDFITAMNGVQLVYELATPLNYQL
jgi:hypothetical protein